MNRIKKFFEEKELERKFKRAGVGHKLTEENAKKDAARSAKPQRSGTSSQQGRSEAAKRAAEAALSRVQQNSAAPVNWSLAAVRAQAKKELELELQASEKEKQRPKEVVQDSCPALAVSGVYFTCSLIVPEVLTRSEIDEKIREFLYEQLPLERGLTSCLIIHSCNKDREKVKNGIEILSRYLTNIIDNPTEEKYRKIRVNNKVFAERVSTLEGVHDYLLAAGFEIQTLKTEGKDEEYYVYPAEKLEDLENLQMLKEALLTAEPLRPSLDRNVRVLLPSQATAKINLPDDFFNLSAEELKKEQEAKTAAVELNSQLRTKAMRERGEIKELRFYRYTLVRVRFPDGIVLQGTFSVHERLSAVLVFITENLADPERRYSLLAPGAIKLTETDKTLLDLKLVPAVLLTLHWCEEDSASDGGEVAYLKPETMSLLQDM